MLEGALAVSKHIKTAAFIINKIGHDIAGGEGGLEEFT